jgi:UDP-N-acetyl-D-glucosamine dehydrogenase
MIREGDTFMQKVLKEKIINRSAKVVVIGLGYVGLPLAVEIAEKGFKVFGIDISKDRIDSLKKGKTYVTDVKDEVIKYYLNKNFFVGSDFLEISKADAIIICVPTPLDEAKRPDLFHVNSVVSKLVNYMKKGTLIVLESTSYPGTTEELIADVIEKKLKFETGKDFFVCFSPERIDPSNKSFNITNTPKIIGGITAECLELGKIFYETFIDEIVTVSSTKVAEMAKLLENTFRSVNIALINELTMMCEFMDINIWEVIDAAATKPYGYMPFYPGAGIGGHCLPVDPIYLSWKAKMYNYYSRFIELTNDINANMPRYVIKQITEILNSEGKAIKGSKIFIVGITYKKDVNDIRESPALEIISLLKEKGADIFYYDPYIPTLDLNSSKIYSINLTKEIHKNADLTVIVTDHSDIDYQLIIDNSKVVYDTRNVTKNYRPQNVVLLGGHRVGE